MNKIYFISDLHITIVPPECRLETEREWVETQRAILEQVTKIVQDDLLVITGDIFDYGLPAKSEEIVNLLVDTLPKNTVFLHGNHCLHGFSAQVVPALQKGVLGTLSRTRLKYLPDGEVFSWGDYRLYAANYEKNVPLKHYEVDQTKTNVILGHTLSYPKEVPFFVKGKAHTVEELMSEYPEYDYYVVGDNHSSFLVNEKYLSPGSLTRRSTKQIKHKPCIWKLEDREFSPTYLNIKPADECMSTAHIDEKKQEQERLNEWASSTEELVTDSLDIEENIYEHIKINKTRDNTKETMSKLIESVKKDKK